MGDAGRAARDGIGAGSYVAASPHPGAARARFKLIVPQLARIDVRPVKRDLILARGRLQRGRSRQRV